MSQEIALLTQIRDLLQTRPDIEQTYQLSVSQPYILDRKDRKYVYLYTTNILTLSIEDLGTITSPSVGWIDITLQQGMRIYATNQTNPVPVLIRCTDNAIDTSTDIQIVQASGNFNNASIGTLEAAIPNSATLIGANDSAGNLDELLVESDANPNLRIGVFQGTNQLNVVNNAAQVNSILAYPTGATPITASSGDVAATATTATLAAVANKTTYITGFTVSGDGATAGSTILVTITNVVTGTLTFVYQVPTGATFLNPSPFDHVTFPYPIPANAQNTTVVVNLPSFGTGNLHACVNAYGFQL